MVAVMFLSALVAAIAIVAVVAMLGYAEFRQRFILWQFNTVHKASLLAQGVPYIHDSGFDYHNQHDYFHGDLFDSSGPHLINAINEMHRMQKDGAGVVLTGRAFNGRRCNGPQRGSRRFVSFLQPRIVIRHRPRHRARLHHA
eukprot:m.66636 g.66636  ORF g.66636 m.66636 type:complete len:142 (-) comp13769_c0_seq3:1341-1766(-)